MHSSARLCSNSPQLHSICFTEDHYELRAFAQALVGVLRFLADVRFAPSSTHDATCQFCSNSKIQNPADTQGGSCSLDLQFALDVHSLLAVAMADDTPRDSGTGSADDTEAEDFTSMSSSPRLVALDPCVHHNIYMAGTRPLFPMEEDMRFGFFQQQIYLIRGVCVQDLPVPSESRIEALSFGLIACGQATWMQLQRLLEQLPSDKNLRWKQDPQERQGSEMEPKRFTVGAWMRGPMTGVNIHARQFPWTARMLSGIVRTWDSELAFSTVTASVNVCSRPHRDSYNHSRSSNLLMPFSEYRGGELFLESSEGMHRLQTNGTVGHIISTHEPVSFAPKQLHATLPWAGNRFVLIAFHISMLQYLSAESKAELERMGFVVGEWMA